MPKKRVILLGSTGSIGQSTLEVVQNLRDELEIAALAAGSKWEELAKQAERFRPQAIAISNPEHRRKLEKVLGHNGIAPRPAIFSGPEGVVRLVEETPAEIVVGAISGAAGLPASIAALSTGKDLALANKESMVCAGAILNGLAREKGRRILPVDSEHSAIFQSLRSGKHEEIREVILTASGGPFRTWSREQMARVTPEEALNHPNWNMGPKITVDSATLMNKALEVIEARWLFDVPKEKIRVVIHSQSIIHSLVEFIDGSMICQLGLPDMKIPIQYALTFPDRKPLPVKRLDFAKVNTLSFEQPDFDRFPSLRMAYEVLDRGGTAAAVFNAANEVAVGLFLARKIGFLEIFDLVERALSSHEVVEDPDLEEIRRADRWAREELTKAVST